MRSGRTVINLMSLSLVGIIALLSESSATASSPVNTDNGAPAVIQISRNGNGIPALYEFLLGKRHQLKSNDLTNPSASNSYEVSNSLTQDNSLEDDQNPEGAQLDGASGRRNTEGIEEPLVSVSDYLKKVNSILSKQAFEYIHTATDDENSEADNLVSFDRWRLLPRMLVGNEKVEPSTMILGKPVGFPVGVAPTAFAKLMHPDGEIGLAKACEAHNTIFTMSTYATTSIEEVAEAVPNARKWFQLYFSGNNVGNENLIKRAEAAGFEAIVVTVDSQVMGRRRAVLRNPLNLPEGLGAANLKPPNGSFEGSFTNLYSSKKYDLSWKDINWIQSITKLPVIIKGILSVEDSKLALENKVQAVWVSNHGGRSLDTVVAPVDALAEITKALGKCNMEFYLDGGIMKGTDIFKGLAVGANMVFVGKATLYGLGVSGTAGATDVLKLLKTEFDLTLVQTGAGSVKNINRSYVRRSSDYGCSAANHSLL